MHQIKPVKNKGVYLTRPFSCFCVSCKSNNFSHCENKNFTGGPFKAQKLPSNVLNVSDDDNDNEEEGEGVEEEERHDFNMLDYDEDMGDEIKVDQQYINFKDLEVDEFLIVIAKRKDDISSEKFVARINKIENEDHIWVEYLKPVLGSPDVFMRIPKPE